jgi:hypothetical protein
LLASVIVRGELSEGDGGGICQLSSTLYNSVDRAGLKIVQRYSHSRNVPYVPPGRDATVSWDGPDFTFQNQYNQPILIRSNARGGTIIVTLYSSHVIEHKPREVPGAVRLLPEEIYIQSTANHFNLKSQYGKLIPWEEANHIVPVKSIFSIKDLETGLTFQVQRRAGKDHADVQPLTKEDTNIMKQIYHGRWSWKRKAILVHSGNEWLAASMNGMPHGGDGIPGNGFSGHFCVHFFRSTTHKSHASDLAHQLMVFKAAGNLKSYFKAASPLILAESFVIAMNQKDPDLLQQASEGLATEKTEFFIQKMESLLSIQTEKRQGLGNEKSSNNFGWNESLSAEVKLKVAIHKKGDSRRKTTYMFTFNRDSKQSPWHIKDIVAEEQRKTQ